MKTKNLIIIGGLVALYLILINSKNRMTDVSDTDEEQSAEESTNTINQGGGGGGSMSGGGTSTTPQTSQATTPTTPTAGTSQVTVMPKPIVKPTIRVVDLDVPTNMDLPALTSGTGIKTETAIQEGGVETTPKPAIVTPPVLSTDESLISGGVRPLIKPTTKSLSTLVNDIN